MVQARHRVEGVREDRRARVERRPGLGQVGAGVADSRRSAGVHDEPDRIEGAGQLGCERHLADGSPHRRRAAARPRPARARAAATRRGRPVWPGSRNGPSRCDPRMSASVDTRSATMAARRCMVSSGAVTSETTARVVPWDRCSARAVRIASGPSSYDSPAAAVPVDVDEPRRQERLRTRGEDAVDDGVGGLRDAPPAVADAGRRRPDPRRSAPRRSRRARSGAAPTSRTEWMISAHSVDPGDLVGGVEPDPQARPQRPERADALAERLPRAQVAVAGRRRPRRLGGRGDARERHLVDVVERADRLGPHRRLDAEDVVVLRCRR